MGDTGKEEVEVVGRNLVLMFDGTWNVRDDWTNVARMFEAVDRVKDGDKRFQPEDEMKPRDGERVQLVKYIKGVGTNHWSRGLRNLAGAMWGVGLSKIMLEGYLWLSENYRPHDNIFVFGFSRGAFTARALVSLVHMCGGVLNVRDTSDAEKKSRLDEAYRLYSNRFESEGDLKEEQEFGRNKCRRVRIKMVGVWDTVGALGVPDSISNITEMWWYKRWNKPFRWVAKTVKKGVGVLRVPHSLSNISEKWWTKPLRWVVKAVKGRNINYYRFHNQALPCIVDEAYHALAIDEHRVDFLPTLWNRRKVLHPMADDGELGIVLPQHQTVEQCWFVGSHCNVGGGIDNDDDPEDTWQLSYEWMQQKAEDAGLRFKWRYTATGQRWRWLRELDNSFAHMAGGMYATTHCWIDRAIIREHLSMAGCKAESLHWSVKLRMEQDSSYRPLALQSQPGEFRSSTLKTIRGEEFVPALVEGKEGKKYHTEIPFEPLLEGEWCECRKDWKTERKPSKAPDKDDVRVPNPLVLQDLHDVARGADESDDMYRSGSDRYDRNGSTESKSLKGM